MTLHIAGLVILSLICIMGVVGNLLIIGSVVLYKRIRVRGNAFIINLAVADMITVAYVMPVGLVSSQHDEMPIGALMCEINAFLCLTSLGVSTQTLMLIALERYFHICKMHIYKKAFTPKLIGLYIFIIWVYTAAWTCQGWTGWTRYGYSTRTYICLYRGSRSYSICLALFGMILPMVVISVCYFKIFRAVKRSRSSVQDHGKGKKGEKRKSSGSVKSPERDKQQAREYRLVVTLFTIVVVFVACWLPAALTLGLAGAVRFPSIFGQIGIWLALSNSSINSIIYGLLNKNFRQGYLYLISVILSCGFRDNGSGSGATIFGRRIDSSSNEPPPVRTAQSKSLSLSTESEGLDMTTLSEDERSPSVSPTNNKPPLNDASRTHQLRPIKYEQEPSSGAPIRSPMEPLVTSLGQSGQSRPDGIGKSVPSSPLEQSLDESTAPSTSGSQSSLLRRPPGGNYGNGVHSNRIHMGTADIMQRSSVNGDKGHLVKKQNHIPTVPRSRRLTELSQNSGLETNL